ncbi:50S ribosomal protein L19 [candidate division Kazan bacterium RIFCSPHIGHO2_01_FULL_49_10]|uniref:50S ribosomal protein L19 n=1 Tax=candidate division Kazan bacterium RIFCSPLOWO2_01_FULL_48_13 TaxID=1798539 RepID=A0A1F4PPA9_UNCK3|nr:MAG: 50S ribosomal protein L19 [candidate division Kazan bacterium RIFCSPHIGHO2_01_FULL_49_10]OGB85440.1 MAG: 50S ribosomal protein L19 [candidate division Kazan bacterium RIFCSPLOWO2_01_FULL_48_13]
MVKSLVQSKSKLPEVHPGDIVRVHQKIKEGDKERIQVFEGIVIKTHGQVGPNATFTVRKIASGVGVERVYLLQSPNIVKIEFKKGSQVRRSKLYYLRELSGKALKMKDKKIDRDVWELVATADEEQVPTEAELAEAVEAAKAQDSAQVTSDAPSTTPSADDTVEAEVPSGEETEEGQA